MDVLRNTSEKLLPFVLLIEGRLNHIHYNNDYNNINNNLHSSIEIYEDDSDVETDLTKEETLNIHSNLNSNSNEDGTSTNRTYLDATVDFKRRYYCIFGLIMDSEIIMESIVSLESNIEIDQLPNQVLLLKSDLVIVSGINGLLLLISKESEKCWKLTNQNQKSSEKLNENENENKNKEMHEIDSIITAIDYYEDLLITSDNNGLICGWKLNYPNSFPILIQSFQLIEKLRIERIVIINENDMIICCCDRIFILTINKMNKFFYIKSILDIIPKLNVIYYPIICDDGIQIYRIMDNNYDPTKPSIIITIWIHNLINQNYNNNTERFDKEIFISEYDDSLPTLFNSIFQTKPVNITENIENTKSVAENLTQSNIKAFEMKSNPLIISDSSIELPYTSIPTSNVAQTMKFGLFSTYEPNLFHINESIPIIHTTNVAKMNENIKQNHKYSWIIRSNDIISTVTSTVTSHINLNLINEKNIKLMKELFSNESSKLFQSLKVLLAIYCACYTLPSIGLLAAALEMEAFELLNQMKLFPYNRIFYIPIEDNSYHSLNSLNSLNNSLILHNELIQNSFKEWLVNENRSKNEYFIDISIGHNYLCALHLKYCGNKSVAVECIWQDYLRVYGPLHLRHSSRKLKELTQNIRKIDETAGIKDTIPIQIGYISGLQEIYARRVGLQGRLPTQLGELQHLRVLSMGNNQLCGELPISLGKLKNLQRIVLHQNQLTGYVPIELDQLGCIVNLAGNLELQHGNDVPHEERLALEDLYYSTSGNIDYSFPNKIFGQIFANDLMEITIIKYDLRHSSSTHTTITFYFVFILLSLHFCFVSFSFVLIGNKWNIKTNWITNQSIYKWYKVGVLSSHVHSIVMSSNGMKGRIPVSIGKLKKLRMIELATMPGNRF